MKKLMIAVTALLLMGACASGEEAAEKITSSEIGQWLVSKGMKPFDPSGRTVVYRAEGKESIRLTLDGDRVLPVDSDDATRLKGWGCNT